MKKIKQWTMKYAQAPVVAIEILDLIRGVLRGDKKSNFKVTITIEMSDDNEYKQGEVIEIDFGNEYSHANFGKKKAIIVQNDIGNKFSSTLIVVPAIFVNNELVTVNPNKVTTVDKERILRKTGVHKDIESIIKDLHFNLGYDEIPQVKSNYKNIKYRRGDIVYVDFGETVGSEQKGIRPALVLQNDILNCFNDTCIVIPISKSCKKDLPTHYKMERPISNDTQISTIMFEQIKEVDASTILDVVDYLDIDQHSEIENIVKNVLFQKK